MLVSNKATQGDGNIAKQDIGLCLGRCPNTKGSVWTYLRGHASPLVRRPLKAMPMTEDWLRHLEDLASKSPSDPDTIFEFRPGFEATPNDVQEQILAEAETPFDPLHPGSAYTYARLDTPSTSALPLPIAASSPERAPLHPAAPHSPERAVVAQPPLTPRDLAPHC